MIPKRIFKPFNQTVLTLEFRLLPSEGKAPWAFEFAPLSDDSLPPVSSEPMKKHKASHLMSQFNGEELDLALEDLDDDLDELDAEMEAAESEEAEEDADADDDDDGNEDEMFADDAEMEGV